MTLSRRGALAALASSALWQAPAFASEWPSRPIRLVWPFATGGLGANLTRVLGDGLSQRLGQPVVIDPKPGAGGVLGFQYTKQATPDGYTIMLGTNSTSTLLPSMQKNLPFDPLKDFEHIGMAYTSGNVIVVRADSDIKSLKDLRDKAKANPGKLTYGSAGNGSTYHLMPALFDQINNTQMLHVPYRGGGPAYLGLLSGEVDVVMGDLSALPQVQAGKMRALGVTSRQRVPAAPDIPTTAELGMPELLMESFYGLFAPKGTPKPIIDRLSTEMAAVLATPTVQRQLETLSTQASPDTSPAYFVKRIREEAARWKPVIDKAGITIE